MKKGRKGKKEWEDLVTAQKSRESVQGGDANG